MCHKHIRHEWPYGLNKKIEKVLLLLGLNPEGCVTGHSSGVIIPGFVVYTIVIAKRKKSNYHIVYCYFDVNFKLPCYAE